MLKKHPLKILILTIVAFFFFFGFHHKKSTQEEKNKELIGQLKKLLNNHHYEPLSINDAFSETIFNNYLENLDPIKRFFTKEDLKEFSKYKINIDEQIQNEQIDFYNLVQKKYLERIENAKSNYKKILSKPFNFTLEESINTDYENFSYRKNNKDLFEYWRKLLKHDALKRIQTAVELEELKQKEDSTYTIQTFDSLEIKIRAEIFESVENSFQNLSELDHTDWFSMYLNTIARIFDPHTTYMAPRAKKNFDIEMSGKIEGIGARLQKEKSYTKVVELISGGPAWKQGELEVGDLILKVAQGNLPPKEIVGMRLDKAIEFIKGKKGTEVRLTVKKVSGNLKTISIIRDIVELEETFVKSSLVEIDHKIYGFIHIPKFYKDFSDPSRRSAASDMVKEIQKLKADGVQGLLVDLRNNGGGSLSTAIDIAGLFIDKGPILQVKYRNRLPQIRSDKKPGMLWDGPLVFLVNELSASASEILVAAMQDYQRAVILGSKQTYGKGTVQQIIPMNYHSNFPEDLGSLKLTIQKFYRINGGSTQLEGVYSDINLPNKYSFIDIGERDNESSLAWDQINRVPYKTIKPYKNFDNVVKASKLRVQNNMKFIQIENFAKWIHELQEDKLHPLNYITYKQEINDQNIESKNYDSIFNFKSQYTFKSPSIELPMVTTDTILRLKKDKWHKNLKEDIYINEALHVLTELEIQ